MAIPYGQGENNYRAEGGGFIQLIGDGTALIQKRRNGQKKP